MNIGILTFYREINFGANIQALSTYFYLKRCGHIPVFIRYETAKKENTFAPMFIDGVQPKCHAEFIDNFPIEQTKLCRNAEEINKEIDRCHIEAIIVGSDAVVQHHPFLSQFSFSFRRILKRMLVFPEQKFPNPFWGININPKIKMAMMSVSNQDSQYKMYSGSLKKKMQIALQRFTYISTRDEWTKEMFLKILGEGDAHKVELTPDPVFNINENMEGILPNEASIRSKYSLPEKYVLFSFHSQCFSIQQMEQIRNDFARYGISCVALPMPLGFNYKHPFNYVIPIPLPPLDWYSLIKYSSGYVGNNMHPIVSSLHNAVPCFAIDIYGARNFWGAPRKTVTSKVRDIMKRFGVEDNVRVVVNGKCKTTSEEIVNAIINFPVDDVKHKAQEMSSEYKQMMKKLLGSFAI